MKLSLLSNRALASIVLASIKVFVFAAVVLTLAISSNISALAQESEIEIVNQDGERVEGARLMAGPRVGQVETNDVTDTKPGANNFLLKSEDGMLTYTDGDGNEQQIDLSNARSVSVQQSTQSVNQNGQQVTKVVSKTIVVDADGNRHEIITDNDGGAGFDLPAMPNGFPKMFSAKRNVNKYMIGVHCRKVARALQAQLGLTEDTGLLVNAVGPNSPAAAAGLLKYDVLLFADDQELSQQEDLVRMVQKAGESNAPLSLTVMRGGKEIGVDVAPVERTADQMQRGLPGGFGGFDFGGLDGGFGNGFGDMQFKQFGPGIILGGDFDDRMENMREQMQQVQQQMFEMQQRMRAQLEAGE
jgi:hypothetical protein